MLHREWNTSFCAIFENNCSLPRLRTQVHCSPMSRTVSLARGHTFLLQKGGGEGGGKVIGNLGHICDSVSNGRAKPSRQIKFK